MYEPKEAKQVKDAIDHRLSGLRADPFLARRIINMEKGEKKVMKKKLSVSLIAIVVTMVLSLGAAFAWAQGHIADQLFGGDATVPENVVAAIQTPEAADAANEYGSISMDEWLYDGGALHTSISIANPTDETLLYTVDGMWLNDAPTWGSSLLMEGAGSAGLLLGGTVDGVQLPASRAVYSRTEEVAKYGANGKFEGFTAIPEGEMTLKVSVAVWKPINTPKVVDYKIYEGVNTTDTTDHLVTDASGYSDLWLLRPDAYYREYNLSQRGSVAYEDAFKEMGWAELLGYIEMEVPVNLNDAMIAEAQPEAMEMTQGDVRLVLEQFSLSQAGGGLAGCIYGENDTVEKRMQNGFVLVDMEKKTVLSAGCAWDEQAAGEDGVHFDMTFKPFADELPGEVYLCPILAMDGAWATAEEKPENVIDIFQLDVENAFRIDLTVK